MRLVFLTAGLLLAGLCSANAQSSRLMPVDWHRTPYHDYHPHYDDHHNEDDGHHYHIEHNHRRYELKHRDRRWCGGGWYWHDRDGLHHCYHMEHRYFSHR